MSLPRETADHGDTAEVALSLQSQLALRALYEYLDECQIALSEIRKDLSSGSLPSGVSRASEKLGSFCVEADSWGFSELYELALRLQLLLLQSGEGAPCPDFGRMVEQGLSALSALLGQCGQDFCCRLAAADARIADDWALLSCRKP